MKADMALKKIRKLLFNPDLFFYDLFRKRLEKKRHTSITGASYTAKKIAIEKKDGNTLERYGVFHLLIEKLRGYGDVTVCYITNSLLIKLELAETLLDVIDHIRTLTPLHAKIFTSDGRYCYTASDEKFGLAKTIAPHLTATADFVTELSTVDHTHCVCFRVHIGSILQNGKLSVRPSTVFTQIVQPNSLTNSTEENKALAERAIDAVYTWVNSNDPTWAQLWSQNFPGQEYELDRYSNNDQLKHSLRSLEMYAPWINKIFIVSNCAPPDWLVTHHPRIQWIEHQEIFPDSAQLPTFNSHAIEACLHNIKDLSENFVYFNDDFFLSQPCHPYDFFDEYDHPVLHFEESTTTYLDDQVGVYPDYIAASINSGKLIELLYGNRPRKQHKHVPYALKKSILSELEATFANAFESTRKAKLRSRTDLNVVSFLFQHYARASGRSTTAYASNFTTKPSNIDKILNNASVKFKYICINDGGDSSLNPLYSTHTRTFYNERFPVPATWEINV